MDDPSHTTKAKRKKDAERTQTLEAKGWTIVRCTNEEALADPEGAVAKMMKAAGLDPTKPLKRCQKDL